MESITNLSPTLPSDCIEESKAGSSKKKLKVALIRPPIVFAKGALNNEATPAIGYAYISSFLKKNGYETVLIDAIGEGLTKTWKSKYPNINCRGLTFLEIKQRIPPDVNVICFSGMFSGEWPIIRDLITFIRESFPDQLFIAGGEHVTALTEYSLKDCPALDVCARGEGEQTLLSILESYYNGTSYFEVNGVGYLNKEGKYVAVGLTRDSRVLKINDLPWPDWPEGYLEKFWASGKSYGIGSARDMPFQFSRGCPFECTFCSNSQMWGQKYFLRDIDDVIEEIKYYVKKYNITSLQLYDLTAITNKRWILEFCEKFMDTGIKLKWSLPSGTRSEVLDKEVLTILKKAGLSYLVYAPESGSLRTLKMVKKRINLDNLTKSALTAKKLGFACRTNLIIGFPGETWKDVFSTLYYGVKMSIKGIDEVPFFVFSPYPGTEIFGDLMRAGKVVLNDKYFLDLTSLNSSYLSIKSVRSFNPNLKAWKLGFIRVSSILLTYMCSYLFYPKRIVRTLKNLRSKNASTVFEHRLKDLLDKVF